MRGPVDDPRRPSSASLPTFGERIRKWIGREGNLFAAGSRFSGAKFEGGLYPQYPHSLAEGLSERDANELRKKLITHIGKPANRQLPDDSGANTMPYTQEEAEKWMAEYEEAMSEVSRDDT